MKRMSTVEYFNRYGKIYGVSYKYEFSRWTGYIKVFDDMKKAIAWMSEEEYDFATRELGSLTYCKSCLSD